MEMAPWRVTTHETEGCKTGGAVIDHWRKVAGSSQMTASSPLCLVPQRSYTPHLQKTNEHLRTERLLLRSWCMDDLGEFSRMHADPTVMHDLGGPVSLDESQAKLLRYISMYQQFGFSRYCVEDHSGNFVGYVGVCPRHHDQAIGKHNEIGWRLNFASWGKGYATEAARACLVDFKRNFPAEEVISYTSARNKRSQRVMARLNILRVPSRDFNWEEPDGSKISLLVWVANTPD